MTETWAYQAANAIEITGDLTAKYWPNQLIKITQGTEKFFVIMAVSLVGGNTKLTVSGGGVYILTSDAITAHHMTTNAAPVGLPSGFLEQGLAYGAGSKDTPTDADRISLWDSVASFGRKNLTWANLKTTLKTYFDGLYAVTGHNHSGTYAPAANGVTNGDSHDHNGGDGAQIDHGGLGGLGDDDHTGYLFLAGRTGAQAITGPITQKIGTNPNSTGQPSGDWAGIIYHAVNAPGKNGLLVKNNWQATASTIFECGGDFEGGAYSSFFKVLGEGSVWIVGNCSALSFTDRTDAFAGDALAAIEKIAADAEGNIDHSTLPEFARSTYMDADGEEQAGRDIGNMVSVLTTGMQQLIELLNYKDVQIADLIVRLEKLEGKEVTA